MVAHIKDLAEEAKVAIRNIRRDANKALDLAEKGKEISEDDRDSMKEDIQEATKKYEALASESAKKARAGGHGLDLSRDRVGRGPAASLQDARAARPGR